MPVLPRIDVDVAARRICGIRAEFGDVPTQLTNPVRLGRSLAVTENEVLLHLRAGSVHVSQGRAVLQLNPAAGPAGLDFALYGWVPSLLMLFQGVRFLHGSVVSRDGVTVALVGQPGAGKSSTVAALMAAGWRLLIDDSAPVVVVDGLPWVVAYERPIHLTPADAAASGLDNGTPMFERNKLAYRAEVDVTPRPLDAVVALQPSTHSAVHLESLTGVHRLAELDRHVHAQIAARTPGRMPATLSWLAALAHLPVWRLHRPRGLDTRAAVVATITREASAELRSAKQTDRP